VRLRPTRPRSEPPSSAFLRAARRFGCRACAARQATDPLSRQRIQWAPSTARASEAQDARIARRSACESSGWSRTSLGWLNAKPGVTSQSTGKAPEPSGWIWSSIVVLPSAAVARQGKDADGTHLLAAASWPHPLGRRGHDFRGGQSAPRAKEDLGSVSLTSRLGQRTALLV